MLKWFAAIGVGLVLAFEFMARALTPEKMTCKKCGVESDWHPDGVCTTCWWDGE